MWRTTAAAAVRSGASAGILALAAACGLDPPSVVMRASDLVAVVSEDEDRRPIGVTGLFRAERATRVGLPAGRPTWVLGWSLSELGSSALPDEATLERDVLRAASRCEPSLSHPSEVRLVQDGEERKADAPAWADHLTSGWLASRCPGFAPVAEVRGVDGAPSATREIEGCRFRFHLAPSVLEGVVLPDGTICVESGQGCTPLPETTAAADCLLSSGPHRVEVYLSRTASAAVTVRPIYRVPLMPNDFVLRGLGLREVRRGYLADLILADGRVIVVGYDAESTDATCDGGVTRSRLHVLDPSSLAEVGTATLTGCLQRLIALPSTGDFIGLFARPFGVDVERLRLSGARTPIGSVPTLGHSTAVAAFQEEQGAWVFVASSEQAGTGVADLVVGIAPSDLSTVTVAVTVPGVGPRAALLLPGGTLAVSAEEGVSVLFFDRAFNASPLPLPPSVGPRLGPLVQIDQRTIALGVLGVPAAVWTIDITSPIPVFGGRGSYFEGTGLPTSLAIDPLNPRRLLVGLAVLASDGSTWQGAIARFDVDRQRFVPGTVQVGAGLPSRLAVDGARVFGINARSAEVFRVSFE
ncbi:MAG: hypothetical protein IT384_24995 [Deltaproteobacteria bacterium]|nr:hypothetical protein [Deltaproteobacteria bacterium]